MLHYKNSVQKTNNYNKRCTSFTHKYYKLKEQCEKNMSKATSKLQLKIFIRKTSII